MRVILALAFAAALSASGAETVRFASGPTRVSLIELYTSEGCSSCPPADQWLGALRTRPDLWKDVVPVEFHVNYWDSLGWKDRLSSPAFTAREYAYAAAWGSPNVYTPCFVRNGLEWKPTWGDTGAAATTAGSLQLVAAPDGTCRVTFGPGGLPAPGGYTVHVALLGGGISSQVTAGENEGSILEHEFVVLGLVDGAMTLSNAGPLQARVVLPKPSVPGSRRRSVAAWVTQSGQLEPIQATGGWLP